MTDRDFRTPGMARRYRDGVVESITTL